MNKKLGFIKEWFNKYKNISVHKSKLPLLERMDTMRLTIRDLRKLFWFQQAELPVARDGLGVAYANHKIYAIGGRSEFDENSLLQSSASFVDEYDPGNDIWVSKEKMLYPHTHHSVVTASNGKIYALGGYIKISIETYNDPAYQLLASKGSISCMLQKYDPIGNKWTKMASMPIDRVFAGAVADHIGSIFVIGGLGYNLSFPDPNNPPGPNLIKLDDVHKYNAQTDTWTSVAPMPTARYGLSAVMGNNGLIYAMGGVDENCARVATVEAYNPNTNTWEVKADMPTARSDLSTVVTSNGDIYALGGTGGASGYDSIDTVEIYTPETDTWVTSEPLLIDRLCFGATITDEDKIYVIGGSRHNCEADFHGFLSSVEKSGL